MSTAAEALERVHDRIGEACVRAGRAAECVDLVAVSKTVAEDRVREMLACGQLLFGENRVQEALHKVEAIGSGARWHLVGHLQRNKARHAVAAFELIHSVDGEALAHEIDRRAAGIGKRQGVLMQVNLSEEATKSGVPERAAEPLLEVLGSLEHVELRGLMIIPPPVERPEESRPWFVRLRELRDRLADRAGVDLPELSMGMTDDFEIAIEEGATLIRVGRALFGERP